MERFTRLTPEELQEMGGLPHPDDMLGQKRYNIQVDGDDWPKWSMAETWLVADAQPAQGPRENVRQPETIRVESASAGVTVLSPTPNIGDWDDYFFDIHKIREQNGQVVIVTDDEINNVFRIDPDAKTITIERDLTELEPHERYAGTITIGNEAIHEEW